VTVGVVTAAWGEKYRAMLPSWATSVAGLDRVPDRVTVAGDFMPDDLRAELDEIIPGWVFIPAVDSPKKHPAVVNNEGIAATDTDWIVRLDVDDVIYPHALDTIDSIDADVLMFGALVNGDPVRAKPISAIDILVNGNNLVVPCSPFRKWVWEKAPYRDMIFEDWVFWVEAAANGAVFTQSDGIDYEYRMDADGAFLSADWADAEQGVLRVRRELGLG
jgi:hypothetical protein